MSSQEKHVIVLGSGGHAKVVIELLQAMGEHVGYCIGGPNDAEFCLQIPVLRGDENLLDLHRQGFRRAIVAIGANSTRQRLAAFALQVGYDLVSAISPHAVVSPSARIGQGVTVMAGAILNAECVVEDLAIINTGATIDHDCTIGRGAHIAPQCALAGNVVVGERSFLGVGCKVIPGVKIGKDVTIGAGGVAIRDIPDDVVAVGVPLRIVKGVVPTTLDVDNTQ